MTAGGGAGEGGETTIFLIHGARSELGQARNTEAGVSTCARLYRAVEVDVAFSSDGVPFLSHGDDFRGAERLSSFVAREIEKESLSLKQFLRDYAPSFDLIVLDIKALHGEAKVGAPALAALLDSYQGQVWVIGLSGVFLLHLQKLNSQIPLGCETYFAWSNRLAGFEILSVSAGKMTSALNERARKAGLTRLYWTAWNDEELSALSVWAPEAVIVDLGGENPPSSPRERFAMNNPVSSKAGSGGLRFVCLLLSPSLIWGGALLLACCSLEPTSFTWVGWRFPLELRI